MESLGQIAIADLPTLMLVRFGCRAREADPQRCRTGFEDRSDADVRDQAPYRFGSILGQSIGYIGGLLHFTQRLLDFWVAAERHQSGLDSGRRRGASHACGQPNSGR